LTIAPNNFNIWIFLGFDFIKVNVVVQPIINLSL